MLLHSLSRSCSKFMFLFIFMCFVLLSFQCCPVLTAAFINLCYYYFFRSQRLSTYQNIKSICYLLSHSVRNYSILIGLYIPYQLLHYSIKQCSRLCITFSQASFRAKCFGQMTLDFHFSV